MRECRAGINIIDYNTSRANYEKLKESFPDYNMDNQSGCDVKSGSWVLIKTTVTVATNSQPVVYGIYWGLPNEDKYGRQSCRIRTIEDIVLLNHEYTVISEEKLIEYRDAGWELSQVQNPYVEHLAMNLGLIERGRALCEEEREYIWALQLDGLTESQACEEHFLCEHTDSSNYTICYLPSKRIQAELMATFGG